MYVFGWLMTDDWHEWHELQTPDVESGNQKNCSKHLSCLLQSKNTPSRRNLNEETDERQDWPFKTLSEDKSMLNFPKSAFPMSAVEVKSVRAIMDPLSMTCKMQTPHISRWKRKVVLWKIGSSNLVNYNHLQRAGSVIDSLSSTCCDETHPRSF